MQQENADDKLGILDVQIRMKDGTRIDIEVNVRRLWLGRSGRCFILARCISGRSKKGNGIRYWKKCVHIGILDFILFENETSYHSRFHIREDQRNFQYSDKLEIHICELPKLKKYTHPETKLLDWMRFLNADQEERWKKWQGKINTYRQRMMTLKC